MTEQDVKPPYQFHLKRSNDLVTTYEATRAGFVAAALEKKTGWLTPLLKKRAHSRSKLQRQRNPTICSQSKTFKRDCSLRQESPTKQLLICDRKTAS